MDRIISSTEEVKWKKVDIASERFNLKHVPKELEKALLVPHSGNPALDYFLCFMTGILFLLRLGLTYLEVIDAC